jgi:hypothetical protein
VYKTRAYKQQISDYSNDGLAPRAAARLAHPPQISADESVTTQRIMKQWNVGVTEPAVSSETSVHGVAFREFVWSRLRESEGGKEKQGSRNDNRLAASVPGNLVYSTILHRLIVPDAISILENSCYSDRGSMPLCPLAI